MLERQILPLRSYSASTVKPEDMIATMYHALGIPNDGLIHDPQKRPHRITDGEPLVGLFG
jgi:hypothetical protein